MFLNINENKVKEINRRKVCSKGDVVERLNHSALAEMVMDSNHLQTYQQNYEERIRQLSFDSMPRGICALSLYSYLESRYFCYQINFILLRSMPKVQTFTPNAMQLKYIMNQ